jgi:YesN/AraC family two-component response regulator
MDKVFYNLISNAFNHVPEQYGEVRLILKINKEDIDISVIDNGSGIPKEDVEKVFNRFFQHDSKFTDSQYKGSGIGLALSEGIIRAHNGIIICESEENKGTTFRVSLLKGSRHLNKELIVEERKTSQFTFDEEQLMISMNQQFDESEDNNEALKNLNAPMMLIVDDNRDIRHALRDLFMDTYLIKFARDGLEGLEKALDINPDLIISDVKMPKLSGIDMCEKLKRNLNTSHIPILLLSALDTEEDRTAGFKHGADLYCAKPYNSEMLKAMVENLFKSREVLQQKFSQDIRFETKNIAQNIVDREFLKKAQEIIENHILDTEFNVDEFASEMQLGRTLFYNKVKTITGQTPNDFIQTIRLKKAADLLLNQPSKNISEIAYETGFNSPRYFSICFKNHFGVNPSKYISGEK